MKIKLLAFLFIFSALSIAEELKFKDVPTDHWAYKSIQNLVNNKIIDQKTFNFNGNTPMTRYEFAYEFSKLLTKIDTEKIDKKEIDVLKSIIYDFSSELNKIGFDYKKFDETLSATREDIDSLKQALEVNNMKLKKLEERINKLEKDK